MKTTLNIIPSTKIIRSWRQDTRIKLDAVIKELVDNSFDWGATEVIISGGSTITVYDNGRGIYNIEEALRFGESESEHKRLGRFGIALKKGPARLGRLLTIHTQNHWEATDLEIDWLKLERSREWSLDCENRQPSGNRTFTQIEITGIYQYRIMGWKDLPAKLSATFAPALRQGKIICFDGVYLEAPIETALEEVIETTRENQKDGRSFHLKAGLRHEGDIGSRGISVNYLHRVITEEWTPKFLSQCNLRRFEASITLIDGGNSDEESTWTLNNFKDDISEEHKAELEEALEPILLPLIERLKDEAHNLRIRTLEKTFSDIVFGRGKHPCLHEDKDGDRINPKVPSNKHGRRRKRRFKQFKQELGEPSEGGQKTTIYGQRTFLFRFDDLKIDETIHIQTFGDSLQLIINKTHKYGAELWEQFNRNDNKALIATAFWALASYMTSKDDYQKLYPYLINGQDNVFEAANKNVSKWLEFDVSL